LIDGEADDPFGGIPKSAAENQRAQTRPGAFSCAGFLLLCGLFLNQNEFAREISGA